MVRHVSGSCASSSTIEEMLQVPWFCNRKAPVSLERHLGRASVWAELTRQLSVTHSRFILHLMHHLSPSPHISVKLLSQAWRRHVLLIFCTFGFCPTWLPPRPLLSFWSSHIFRSTAHRETPLPAAVQQTDWRVWFHHLSYSAAQTGTNWAQSCTRSLSNCLLIQINSL